MATAAQSKRCKVCGTDVSQAKRTKDAAGNYYCDPCVQAARQPAANPTAQSPQPSSRNCANCGKTLGALEQGAMWQNHLVCAHCIGVLQTEVAEQKYAAEEAANQATVKAEEKRQAQAKRRRARSRAFWGQCETLFGTLFCGAVALAAAWVAVAVPRDDAGQPPNRLLPLAFTAFFGLLAAFFVFRFRRIRRQASGGDEDALLRRPGLPAYVGTPIAVGLSLIGLALGLFVGFLGATLIGDMPVIKSMSESSTSIVWWVCMPFGTLLGLFAAGAVWEQFRLSQCPRCRQYGVVAIVASEHAGTTFSTYNTMERVVTKGIDGQIIATSNVPTQRLETTETSRQFCRCGNCRHEWSRLRSWTSR